MKKIIFTIFILTILFSGIFSAEKAFAQISYTPLTPIPGTTVGNCAVDSEGKLIDPDNCTVPVTSYISTMFMILIGLAGVLAVLMIVIGGVQYLSTDAISGKSEGKEKITNAILGLLLAIGCWVILNTINPGALSFNLDTVGTIDPSTITPGTITPPPPTQTTCIFSQTCRGDACYSQCPVGTQLPDASAETNALNANNINIIGSSPVSPICSTSGQPACTTVYGLGRALNGLIGLRNACPSCVISITGGTEFWRHETHGYNAGQVDLRYTAGSALVNYIENNGTYLGTNNTCYPGQPAWRLNLSLTSTGIYVFEKNSHWHICY